MLPLIKRLYKKTLLKKSDNSNIDDDVPETWIKIFYKEYPRLKFISLSNNTVQSEYDTLLSLRESSRYFSDRVVSFDDFSKILSSCKIVDTTRDPEKRTYPSGGARFPVEIYLISHNIENLEQGAYHYNIKRQGLELLLQKDLRGFSRDLISPYLENPAATIIFTSVLSRSEIKYGYKAFQYSFLEAGHMGQNMLLKCAEIGIGCCPVSGFVNDTVNNILDITSEEIPLYTISIGWRKNI